jgi:hypothetical protein
VVRTVVRVHGAEEVLLVPFAFVDAVGPAAVPVVARVPPLGHDV